MSNIEVIRALQKLLVAPRDPRDALRTIEVLSRDENSLDNQRISTGIPINSDPQLLELQALEVTRLTALLKVRGEDDDDSISSVKPPPLLDDLRLLQWAGIGLGMAEAYRLQVSIKRLAEKLPDEVGALRFWGRVSTLSLPYYVVEGGNAEEEEDGEPEREGKDGANKNAYWVSQTLGGADSWTQLPTVTCAQVVVAAQCARLFTGRLYILYLSVQG